MSRPEERSGEATAAAEGTGGEASGAGLDPQMAYLLPSLPAAIVPARVRRWSLAVLLVPLIVALVAPASDWSSAVAALAIVPVFLHGYAKGWRAGVVTAAGAVGLLWVGQHVADVQGGPPVDWAGITALSLALLAVVGAAYWLSTKVRLEWTTGFEDETTGLPERPLVEAFLRQSMAAARRGHTLSVVLVGLDGGETSDGRFDDHEREEALRRVASILNANTRDTDFAGRYGEASFLVVTPGEPSFGVSVFADRIRQGVGQLDYPPGVGCTVSAGVAAYDRSVTEGADLVARAQDALTWARNLGGDRIIIHGRPAYREGPVRGDYKAGHHRVN